MDITFTLNGTDYSALISTYNTTHEITYSKLITTMDGTEHIAGKQDRVIINFSLIPLSDAQSAALYNILSSQTVTVMYTDSNTGDNNIRTMRVNGSINSAFGLRSINGNRYYKGISIQLRSLVVT